MTLLIAKEKFSTNGLKTTLNIQRNGGFFGKIVTKNCKLKAKMLTIMITNPTGFLIGPKKSKNCIAMKSKLKLKICRKNLMSKN